MTKIPIRAISSFFNRLRRINKIKVDKKTTIKDLNSFVRKNRESIASEIANDKRSRGLYASFFSKKKPQFREAIENAVKSGKISTYERKGKTYIRTRNPFQPNEIRFLEQRSGMRPKDLVKSYFEEFGKGDRTAKSIASKFLRIRSQRSK